MFFAGKRRWLFQASVPLLSGSNTSVLEGIGSSSIASVSVVAGSITSLDAISCNSIGNASALLVTATPTGGVFTGTLSVTLSADRASRIYYTLDGTDPAILIGDDGIAIWSDDGMEIIMDGG